MESWETPVFRGGEKKVEEPSETEKVHPEAGQKAQQYGISDPNEGNE